MDGAAALEEFDLANIPEITETDAFTGFLPVDGAAVLEEINVAKIPEITEADAFTGLYWMDSDMDNGYTDNRSDTDAKAMEEPEGARESLLGGLYGNGFRHQPPSIHNVLHALEDLTSLLLPQRQKQKGQNAGDTIGKTLLDPGTLTWLEDIQNFLWRYCDFDTDSNPRILSAGMWTKASVDIADYRIKGPMASLNLACISKSICPDLRTPNVQS